MPSFGLLGLLAKPAAEALAFKPQPLAVPNGFDGNPRVLKPVTVKYTRHTEQDSLIVLAILAFIIMKKK